jgi:hypothetical protein
MGINTTINQALSLAADGAEWIAGSGVNVANLDAVSLAILATPRSPFDGNGPGFVSDMARANDGKVAVAVDAVGNCAAGLAFYDPRKLSYTLSSYTGCIVRVGGSADGSRLLVIDQSAFFSTGNVFLADTTAGTLTTTGLQAVSSFEPVLDRAGDRIAINLDQSTMPSWQIYDGAYAPLGKLPTSTLTVILSPDGHKAHAYDQSGLLRSYDLTAAPVAGIFPEIGTGITLAGSPGSNSMPIRMAITPDGATVFLAGSAAVVVQPVP